MAVETLSGPPFPGGVFDDPEPGLVPLGPEVEPPVLDAPLGALAFAVVAWPWDPAAVVPLVGGPLPGGTMGDLDGDGFEHVVLTGATRREIVASESFATGDDDEPAHAAVPGLLAQAWNYEAALFDGIEPSGQRRAPGFGAIGFDDPRGDLDRWADYAWDSRAVELRRGPSPAHRPAPYRGVRTPYVALRDWPVVARAVTAAPGLEPDWSARRLLLRDAGYRLTGQTLSRRLRGTGGLDGDAAAIGAVAPLLFGRVRNVEPLWLLRASLVLMAHDGRMQAILAVRQGGSPLTFAVDLPDLAALLAWTPVPGFYATCLALGLLRLGGQPDGRVTLDAWGDATPLYVESRAAIARRLATTRGLFPFAAVELDEESFLRCDAAHPAAVGFAALEEIDVGAALDALMAGILGWWHVGLDGRVSLGWLREPSAADFALDRARGDLDGAQAPRLVASSTPRYETRVGWGRAWTRQSEGEMHAGVTAAQRAAYVEDWRWATVTDAAVRGAWPSAASVAVEGLFDEEGPALAEAGRQQALLRTQRHRFAVAARIDPYARVLGRTADLRGLGRRPFGASRLAHVVGQQPGATARTVDLHVWL